MFHQVPFIGIAAMYRHHWRDRWRNMVWYGKRQVEARHAVVSRVGKAETSGCDRGSSLRPAKTRDVMSLSRKHEIRFRLFEHGRGRGSIDRSLTTPAQLLSYGEGLVRRAPCLNPKIGLIKNYSKHDDRVGPRS